MPYRETRKRETCHEILQGPPSLHGGSQCWHGRRRRRRGQPFRHGLCRLQACGCGLQGMQSLQGVWRLQPVQAEKGLRCVQSLQARLRCVQSLQAEEQLTGDRTAASLLAARCPSGAAPG